MYTAEAIGNMSLEEMDQVLAECSASIKANLTTLAILQLEFEEIEAELAESYAALNVEF